MLHISFDLETLGSNSKAPIVQIGAVCFNLEGKTSDQYESKIALGKDFQKFQTDLSTIEWWIQQPNEVSAFVFDKDAIRVPLLVALQSFSDWVKQLPGQKKKLWSHATFDAPVLMNAYEVLGVKPSFHYRDFVDIRTLNFLTGHTAVVARENFGLHHDALADAKFQAAYIAEMLRKVQVLP